MEHIFHYLCLSLACLWFILFNSLVKKYNILFMFSAEMLKYPAMMQYRSLKKDFYPNLLNCLSIFYLFHFFV